jgi:myo-inositol-1(or 4)-monophosphatase
MQPQGWTDLAADLAKELAMVAKRLLSSRESAAIERPGTDKSPVYRIDLELERCAVDFVQRREIPAILRTEDSGVVGMHPHPTKVIILDPLDGSTNAIRAVPFYCVSVAVGSLDLQSHFQLESVEAAAVFDIPNNDLYTATRGHGSNQNGASLSASGCTDLGVALLAGYLRHAPASTAALADRTMSVRTTGAAALDLCLLAKGSFDCFVDIRNRLRPVDIAAGALIAYEADCAVKCSSAERNPAPESERVNVVAAATSELQGHVLAILHDRAE